MRVVVFKVGLTVLGLALTAAACGGGSEKSEPKQASPVASATTGSASTAGGGGATAAGSVRPSASTAPGPSRTAVALKPSIKDALSCRIPPVQAQQGGQNAVMQRQTIDVALFPEAACNDGSPAVLNFRPFEGEANRNKWVIGLAGGGSCFSGQDCADRWCGVGTNFDADNMSSENAGQGSSADGVFRRAPENPFGNWNQVFVRYCSSDLWTGKASAVSIQAKDPKTGKDVTFQLNFNGASVFEALMATLRQENVPALVYTRGGARVQMPDLDQATEVVLAGGSAGGAGVIFNLDRMADILRHGRDVPVVRGLMDAILAPERSGLNYSQTEQCKTKGVCTYEATFKGFAAIVTQGAHSWSDQSCLDWHQKNEPGSEWKCYDMSHVVENHITTPFFVRMGLTDALISANDIETGVAGADGRVFTRLSWGVAMRNMLMGLQSAVSKGEERASTPKLPGVFAPSCSKHYTIYADETTYGVSVVAGGKAYTLFDAWNNWVAGQKPDAVVSEDPQTDKCPGDPR